MKVRCLKRKTDPARRRIAKKHTARKRFYELMSKALYAQAQRRKGFARRYLDLVEKEKQQVFE